MHVIGYINDKYSLEDLSMGIWKIWQMIFV